jgi:Mrp family chromosome partitioning ATPase
MAVSAKSAASEKSPPVDMSCDLTEEVSRLLDLLNPTFVEGEGLIVQFIGSRKGEGTSTVARAFARVAMNHINGDVLLLNLDLNDNTQALHFHKIGQSLGLGGLSQPLPTSLQTDQLVRIATHPDRDPSIDQLMTLHRVGTSRLVINRFSNSPQIARAKIINERKFWQDAKKEFLLTVVDSPALSDSPDGIVVSQYMDSVIMVVEAETTRMPVAENLKSNLLGQGANITGFIFNKRQFYIPKQIYRML